MKLRQSVVVLVLCVSVGVISALAAPQARPPVATAEEQRVYEAFRAWITMQPVDVCEYPDSRKIGAYAEKFRHMTRADEHRDYWDGEV